MHQTSIVRERLAAAQVRLLMFAYYSSNSLLVWLYVQAALRIRPVSIPSLYWLCVVTSITNINV